MEPEFKPWPKIPRIKENTITISEKIDGTNACLINENGSLIGCQSRNRMIKLGDDNMGFAFWADQNKDEIAKLGDGYHYGEWAGPGIQKNPHKLEKKEFFLFNTFRPKESLPSCINQVSTLYVGPHSPEIIEETMESMWELSKIAGYKPEGIVVYYHDTRNYSKKTFENSEGKWKGQ
jgi:hypothetical protein